MPEKTHMQIVHIYAQKYGTKWQFQLIEQLYIIVGLSIDQISVRLQVYYEEFALTLSFLTNF